MARRDYLYDPEAPEPNPIHSAGAAVRFRAATFCCCAGRTTTKWTMPGSTLDFGESLTDCAIREVREEAGLQIRITGLIGTYTDPYFDRILQWRSPAGVHVLVYAAEIEPGELRIDDESKEAAWVPLPSAVELPLAESQNGEG